MEGLEIINFTSFSVFILLLSVTPICLLVQSAIIRWLNFFVLQIAS